MVGLREARLLELEQQQVFNKKDTYFVILCLRKIFCNFGKYNQGMNAGVILGTGTIQNPPAPQHQLSTHYPYYYYQEGQHSGSFQQQMTDWYDARTQQPGVASHQGYPSTTGYSQPAPQHYSTYSQNIPHSYGSANVFPPSQSSLPSHPSVPVPTQVNVTVQIAPTGQGSEQQQSYQQPAYLAPSYQSYPQFQYTHQYQPQPQPQYQSQQQTTAHHQPHAGAAGPSTTAGAAGPRTIPISSINYFRKQIFS